jgi:hypothetical protein
VSREELSFESVARIHMSCESDRQRKGLHAWLDALRGDAVKAREETPLRTLKEISKLLGHHYTSLTRLGVQACGVSFGGRLRYDLDAVRSYLMGPECAARREELRRKRKDGVR